MCTAAAAGGIAPLVRLPDGERNNVLRAAQSARAMARASERTHLFTQVETTMAVDNIDDILAVAGLSGIFIGPGALSVNLGVDELAD